MVTRTYRGRDAGRWPDSRRYSADIYRRAPNGPFAGYQLAPSRCSCPARREQFAAPTTTCARKAGAFIPQLRDKRFWRAGDITLDRTQHGPARRAPRPRSGHWLSRWLVGSWARSLAGSETRTGSLRSGARRRWIHRRTSCRLAGRKEDGLTQHEPFHRNLARPGRVHE
jgi:hypothetical protein